ERREVSTSQTETHRKSLEFHLRGQLGWIPGQARDDHVCAAFFWEQLQFGKLVASSRVASRAPKPETAPGPRAGAPFSDVPDQDPTGLPFPGGRSEGIVDR
ncbi:hypothetical protein, partial [Roseibium sp.]|uniref:hypothetical protein n=1 Tax=Roseibium sp. TaxID=1936156 RepID=UPI003D1035E5